ncbi:MAG: PKD domain-containing protein [Actinobacteria bacterium]|nr:MAG: PKD domain-containing protein [Actinomycetota bacterium]
MRTSPLLCRIHARLHADERGFTMVEAMVAGMILAIGAFAVAQSLQFGLKSTGMARQRAAAETFANQQMEQARTLNYSHVILFDDPNPAVTDDLPVHSNDPNNPDYWVTNGPPLNFDPDGSGPLGAEPVISANTSPALIHHEDDKTNGNTTFTIDRYVTWVDSPADGLGAADINSNPSVDNGAGDANGHDMKRVTIVVIWPNAYGSAVSQLRISSLFSIGNIPYHGTTPFGAGHANSPPSVYCPLDSSIGRDASFSAQASDSDGTVQQIDWDFGDGTTLENGGVNQNHTYQHTGTYTITNTVWDDVGATATNSSLNCTIQITNKSTGNPDTTPPTGTIVIAGGATYTNTLQVVLTLSATDTGGSGLSQMQFSNDGVTFGAAIAYATTSLYTLPSGDGLKFVYVRYIDGAGNVSLVYSDGITLDTTAPGVPTGVHAARTKITGQKVDITVTWSPPSPSPSDLAGYRVYRQIQGGYLQVGGDLPKTTLSYVETNLDKAGSYTYCVSAFDLAGNESAKACIAAPV